MARPGLTKNIKFKLLVARLGLPRAHVLGHLEFLWEWAHESGSAHLGAPDAVECAAEWQGERGALFTALRDGKWIDPAHDCDDEWIIHDYYHHAPRYVKERARKELQRQKSGAKRRTRCAAKSSQGAKRRSPPAPAPAPAHPKDNTPPTPPTGGDGEKKSVALPPIPESLDTPDFRDAWAAWLKHRSERKPKVTPESAKQAFRDLAVIGPERAVVAIRHSIGKGWQGIFEPKNHGPPNTSANMSFSGIKEFLQETIRDGHAN